MQPDSRSTATGEVARMLGLDPESATGAVIRAFAEKFGSLAPALEEAEVELFDLVFLDLARDGSVEDRAALARALAPVANAPRRLVVDLAHDEAIIVAGPLLETSLRLDEDVLVSIATEKGQDHLAHIAVRRLVSEPVSEVLAYRGEAPVLMALIGNSGARFSDKGRAVLVERSFAMPDVFVAIDRRSDFGRAIIAAFERRSQGAPPVVAVRPLNADAEVARLAGQGEIERALAVVAIESRTRHRLALRLYRQDTLDSFVHLARAADLSWGTVVGLLLKQLGVGASAYQINQCRSLFERTSRPEALVRAQTLTKADAARNG